MARDGEGKEGTHEKYCLPGAFSINGAYLTNLRYGVVVTNR